MLRLQYEDLEMFLLKKHLVIREISEHSKLSEHTNVVENCITNELARTGKEFAISFIVKGIDMLILILSTGFIGELNLVV